jgi:uncharacterized protein
MENAVDAPLAHEVTAVIQRGDAASLRQLLTAHPALANARLDGRRTLLHVVTDWPGRVPEGAAKVRVLVAAGADVNARFTGPHSETPLHWAASSDDLEALDALLDRARDELARSEHGQEDLDNALWCAAHGGRREATELLIDRGADPAWVGHDDLTAAAAAERSEAHALAAWLRER